VHIQLVPEASEKLTETVTGEFTGGVMHSVPMDFHPQEMALTGWFLTWIVWLLVPPGSTSQPARSTRCILLEKEGWPEENTILIRRCVTVLLFEPLIITFQQQFPTGSNRRTAQEGGGAGSGKAVIPAMPSGRKEGVCGKTNRGADHMTSNNNPKYLIIPLFMAFPPIGLDK
jgi:hypothetical protein